MRFQPVKWALWLFLLGLAATPWTSAAQSLPAGANLSSSQQAGGAVAQEKASNAPLRATEVGMMVVRGDSSQQIAAQLRERGLAFRPDPEYLWSLSAIGATTEVLDAVRAARVVTGFHFDPASTRKASVEAEQTMRAALKDKPDNPVLHRLLGTALEYQKRDEEAIAEYREAIRLKGDYALAHYYLGDSLHEKGDIAGAVAEYRRAAELGNAGAQSELGWCYYVGLGVPQDSSEAVNWIRKAAEQGEASGQNRLGVCYEEGKGVPRDEKEAVAWYRRAAEQGSVLAEYNLAQKYNYGIGVRKDFAEAANWYRKAAEQGYTKAQVDLGVAYMEGEGVPKNEEEGVKWFEEASRQGDAQGTYYVGLYYWNKGDALSHSLALNQFELAATQGSPFGAFTLGEIYSSWWKSRGETDNQRACVWYRIAEQLDKRGGGRLWNPAEVKKMREELPKRIGKLREKLSPIQFADCQRQASEWIENHLKPSPE